MAALLNSVPIPDQMRVKSQISRSGTAVCGLWIGLLLLSGTAPAQEPLLDQGVADLRILLDRVEPQVVPAGSRLSVVALVQNTGTQASPPFTVDYLLYQNEGLSEGEILLHKVSLPPLQANSGTGLPWQGELPNVLGRQWIRVCLITEDAKSDLDRNCTEAQQISVPHVDLAINEIRVRPDEVVSGVPIVLQATLENLGEQPSKPTKVRYVLSLNPSVSKSDMLLGLREVPAIGGGERWTEPIRSVLEAAPRNYWIGACVDGVEGDISLENDCSYGLPVTVLKDEFPDLAVQAVKVNPEVWSEGTEVDFYAELVNIGEKASTATELQFYLSEDGDISDADILLGTAEIEAVAPGKQFNAYLLTDPPALPGVYWLGVCIAPTEDELDTFDNCYTGIQVEVTAFQFSD